MKTKTEKKQRISNEKKKHEKERKPQQRTLVLAGSTLSRAKRTVTSHILFK